MEKFTRCCGPDARCLAAIGGARDDGGVRVAGDRDQPARAGAQAREAGTAACLQSAIGGIGEAQAGPVDGDPVGGDARRRLETALAGKRDIFPRIAVEFADLGVARSAARRVGNAVVRRLRSLWFAFLRNKKTT